MSNVQTLGAAVTAIPFRLQKNRQAARFPDVGTMEQEGNVPFRPVEDGPFIRITFGESPGAGFDDHFVGFVEWLRTSTIFDTNMKAVRFGNLESVDQLPQGRELVLRRLGSRQMMRKNGFAHDSVKRKCCEVFLDFR